MQKVYCGHEYATKNLKFALAVDGNNKAVVDKFAWAEVGRCAVPKYTAPMTACALARSVHRAVDDARGETIQSVHACRVCSWFILQKLGRGVDDSFDNVDTNFTFAAVPLYNSTRTHTRPLRPCVHCVWQRTILKLNNVAFG